MLKANEKETESAPKNRIKLAKLAPVIVLVFVFLSVFLVNTSKQCDLTLNVVGCLDIELVDSVEERRQGLSGRPTLDESKGMLFDFEKPDIQCMWMKDMSFALDIVWLDEGKEIIKIEENIRPETFPDKFCSEYPAKYVLEVNAGTAGKAKLAKGQTLSF